VADATITLIDFKLTAKGALRLTFDINGQAIKSTFSAKRTARGGVVGFDFDVVTGGPDLGRWKLWGSRQHTLTYAASCANYLAIDIDALRALLS